MNEIELGDTVEDINTGFKGVAIAKIEFLNGCIQYDVAPRVGKDNKIIESTCIDSGSLKVIKKKKIKVEEDEDENNGGPYHKSIKMRGY